ncbi:MULTISPECIES: hypothetical protein [unclassified Polaribacter]|uniref:hypothetical protein n=1 Tax=unclassified Polaribacter TaxID=196858 RepID=UPI0011BEE2AA|nr:MULTISPECIES: hypothetical protein [unclassified Polaribacter]TXD50262.1 hypothetical protein ES043_16795 [Polaribacter sp. IC063]TXD57798.1 hypothetical protein ES044_13940 [Polaribacter sp. IC066]
MKENSFSNKMRKKSDEELALIFEQKDNYTDEALEAVVLELDARNLIDKAIVSKYKRVQEEDAQAAVMREPTVLKNFKADESPFEELVQPVLYSKKAIQGFTIFFSTLFGAVLLMSNLKEMNKPKERLQVLLFGIGYTVFTLVLLNFIPGIFFITLIFNIIGYTVLVEYFWNKHLGKEVEHQKKAISKPLIISLGILVLIVLLQFLPTLLQ